MSNIIESKKTLIAMALDKNLRKSELRILVTLLVKYEGDADNITVQELAEYLNLTRNSIYNVLSSLTKKGYISCEGYKNKTIMVLKYNKSKLNLRREEFRILLHNIRNNKNTINMLRVIMYVVATRDFPMLIVSTQWELAKVLNMPITSLSITLRNLTKRDIVSLENVRKLKVYTLKRLVYSPLYVKRIHKVTGRKIALAQN